MQRELPYEDWLGQQLPAFTEDVMWKMDSLKVALYLVDLARIDLPAIRRVHTNRVASQLLKAIGSIGANLTEGYSRATLPDRALFFSYSLGSLRESIWWYATVRDALDDATFGRRLVSLIRERRILVARLRATHAKMKKSPFQP